MNDEIRRKLKESMPKIARVYLAEYIRKIKETHEIELPELMLMALRKLPNKGRIRYAKHLNVLTSVDSLLSEVPDDDKRKEEILGLYQQALERT